MDWLRINKNLPQHPKAKALARALGEPSSWWRIAQVWMWCTEYARDGVIRTPEPELDIEDAAGWTGERGAFANACVHVGFLHANDDGTFSVHDWEDHNGAALKKADKDAKRMRNWRENKKKLASDANANVTRTQREPNAHVRGDVTGRDVTGRDVTRQQQQQPVAVAADPPLAAPENRITGRDLRELWNQAAAPPARLPPWTVFPAPQEMQADAAALEFDRATWGRAFQAFRSSAFLNGLGPKGFVLTPAKLLKNPKHWVTQALNGEYTGSKDLREEPAESAASTAVEPLPPCRVPGCKHTCADRIAADAWKLCAEHRDAFMAWQAELARSGARGAAVEVDAWLETLGRQEVA
jgi:hypothetical protein